MILTLQRFDRNVIRTTGVCIIGEDRGPFCLTMESTPLIIPAGEYPLSLYDSPRFGRTVILLHDVPDRTFIEFHPGNVVTDTEGCIIVGLGYNHRDDMLSSSRIAFEWLIRSIVFPARLRVRE